MTQEQPSISEADRAFMQKLGQFRTTLTADEQQMLDALVLAAHGVRREDTVRGYQEDTAARGEQWYIDWDWFWGQTPANPQWYTGQLPSSAPPLAWWRWRR